MSASVARSSKTTGGGQIDTYLEAAPQGTSRRVIESLIKRHNGDSGKIHEEINGLWDSQETRQSSAQSSGEWQNVTKRGRNTKDKRDSRPNGSSNGNRRGQNAARGGRPDRERRSERERRPQVQRQAAPAARPAPQPRAAVVRAEAPQPQDDTPTGNPAEKEAVRPAVPTSSGNSWSRAAPFAERIKAKEQARKEAEELQKKQMEQARSQQNRASPTTATAVDAAKTPTPLDDQQAKDQAFPVLKSKVNAAHSSVEPAETGADENSAAANVPKSSWASMAMQPPKPKAPVTAAKPAQSESPVKSTTNVTPEGNKTAETKPAEPEAVTEPKKQAAKAPVKNDKAASASKPASSSKNNNKSTRPVKNTKSDQSARKTKKSPAATETVARPEELPSTTESPATFVKLPAHFEESEEFAFGGFAVETNKSSTPQVGAWGANATSSSTSEAVPKASNDKSLNEREEAFVNGLMSGTSTSESAKSSKPDVKTPPPGIEAPMNASEFEAKALASADATASEQSSSSKSVQSAQSKAPQVQSTSSVEAKTAAQPQKSSPGQAPVQSPPAPQPTIPSQTPSRPPQRLQQPQHFQQQPQYLQQPPVPPMTHAMQQPMHHQPQQRLNQNNNKGNRKNNRNNRNNKQYPRMPHEGQSAPGFAQMEYPPYSQQQQDNVYGYPQQSFGQSDLGYGASGYGYTVPQQPDNNFYGVSSDPSRAPPPGMDLESPQPHAQAGQTSNDAAGESASTIAQPQQGAQSSSFMNVPHNAAQQQMPQPAHHGQASGSSNAISGYRSSTTPPPPQPQYQGGGYAAPPGMAYNGYYPQGYNYGTYAAYPTHYSSGRSSYAHGGGPNVYDQRTAGSGYGFDYEQAAGYQYDQHNYSGLGSANTSEQTVEGGPGNSSGNPSSQSSNHLQPPMGTHSDAPSSASGQQSGVGSGASTGHQPHPSPYGQAPMYPSYGSQYQQPGQQNPNWMMAQQQQQQQSGFNQHQTPQQGQYQQAPATGYRGNAGGNWTRG